MKLTLNGLNSWVVVLVLLATPLMSHGELLALFHGTLTSQVENHSGMLKFVKDIYFVFALVSCLFCMFNFSKMPRWLWLTLVAAIFLVLPSLFLALTQSVYLLASGLRWYLPLILMFLYPFIDEAKSLKKYVPVLVLLISLNLSLQIIQFFWAEGYWYGTIGDYSLRNPGIFLIPSTSALFVCFALYYIWYSGLVSGSRLVLLFLASGVSILFTASATGAVIFALVSLVMVAHSKPKILPALMMLAAVFIFYFFELLTLRHPDFLQLSGGTRLNIFIDSFASSKLLHGVFGHGTNTAVLVADGSVMDSFYASVIVNLGSLYFFIFVAFLFVSFICLCLRGLTREGCYLVMVTLAMCATVITEAYPVNLLIILTVALMLRINKRLKNTVEKRVSSAEIVLLRGVRSAN